MSVAVSRQRKDDGDQAAATVSQSEADSRSLRRKPAGVVRRLLCGESMQSHLHHAVIRKITFSTKRKIRRKYSFIFSKQLRSDCPHDRGVNSRILASSFALVLADSRTATRLLLWSLKRKPRKWTFPGVVTELFSSLI